MVELSVRAGGEWKKETKAALWRSVRHFTNNERYHLIHIKLYSAELYLPQLPQQ